MAHSTRFLGSNEPLQIFQDDMFEPARPMTSHAPMPSVTRPARRPLGSANSNVVLNPPSSQGSSHSPNKAKSSSPRSPLKISGAKLNMVSMAPPVSKQKMTDSLMKKPQLSNFKTSTYGKENMHPMLFPNAPAPNLSVDRYYQKDNGKRALMDAAPIRDARAPKKIKAAPEPPALPAHDSFPAIIDDGTKPAHSYAQLIGMAILRSPLRRLTLAQIYKWISDNYSFYNPNDAGWQNSIRHNLSLHKNFIKIERPKDDPGKGNYWGIEPGTEQQFLKEKPPRKSAPSAENIPVMSTRLEPSRPAPSLMSEPTLPPHIHMHHSSLPPLPTKASRSAPAEISSDATIPISDGLAPEDGADRNEPELPGDNLFSPVHSSPPVARRGQDGTPPSMNRNASSAIRSQKRRFTSMEDSGYMSSFESSVMRPNQKAMLLTSEADRPRIKRGRAEEEIARLRNSSPFSPTKSRSFAYGPISSSPLRQINENQMLPPLTPVVKMKASVRPPPSVSPNTNLRLHRDKVRHMLQSPLRRVTGVEDNMPWSPAFQLDETIYSFDDLDTNVAEFDIFQDIAGLDEAAFPVIGSVVSGSPVKRVNKRARLDRSMSTSALNEMTNSGKKSITSAPLLRVPEHSPMKFLETPSKVFEGMSSPSRLFRASPCRNSPSKFSAAMLDMPADSEWPTLSMGADDFLGTGADGADFSGLDIMQGFQKIGAGKGKGSKPGLERSYTSTF